MSQNTETAQAAVPKPLNDVQEMGTLVLDWFQNRHRQVAHLLDLPENDTLELVDQDTGETVHIAGDQLKIFMKGVMVAQSFFAEPPFKVSESADLAEQPTA